MSDKGKDTDLDLENQLADELLGDGFDEELEIEDEPSEEVEGIDDSDADMDDDISDIDMDDDIEFPDDDFDIEDAQESEEDELEDKLSDEERELNALEKEEQELDESLSTLKAEEESAYGNDSDSEEDAIKNPEEIEEEEVGEEDLEGEHDDEPSGKNKIELITNVGIGVFVLLAGAWVYNMMFSDNSEPDPTIEPVVITKPVDATPAPVMHQEKPAAMPKPDYDSKDNDGFTYVNKEQEATADVPDSEKPNTVAGKINMLGESIDKKTTVSVISIDDSDDSPQEEATNLSEAELKKETVDINAEVYKTLTKGLARADALNLVEQSGELKILTQDGITQLPAVSGTRLNYYGSEVTVTSTLLDGKLALLSNGMFVDKTRTTIDASMLRLQKLNETLAEREKNLEKQKEIQEQNRLAEIAAAKAKQKAEIEAKANAAKKDSEIQMLTDRLNKLASQIEKKESEEKAKLVAPPTLLEGWSVNGKFTTMQNGMVLKGYLIRTADGEFVRVLAGETYKKMGLVRGYDDNGRFFIGNSFIL